MSFPTVVSELELSSHILVQFKMEGAVTYESDMIKLTVDNYSYQKFMMEGHLICKDLVESIQNENLPTSKNANEWNVLNHKAVATIRKYTDQSLFEHVLTFDNAYKLWKHLESLIQMHATKLSS